MRRLHGAMLGVGLLAACNGDPAKTLDREALMDPASCEPCHAEHVREWSGSMHAYAATDPVFLAMNARGQRETGGELGDFCVSCHAPMAVRTGATTDGLNLDELPDHLKGVTCFFCHTAESVEGTHNAPIILADDDVLRAAIPDPVQSDAHAAGYSPLLDRDAPESAALCGSCHDIVTPAGVHLERTFLEWGESLFGNGATQMLTCGNCHMPGRRAPAADAEGVLVREVHAHTWPAVDTALVPFPEREEQLRLVKEELASTLVGQLCVTPPLADSEVTVNLENAFAGHSFPSGAAQDRRSWVEVIAYEGDVPIFQSGVIPAGEAVVDADPDAWLFRDRVFGPRGDEVHMFWDVASYESNLLPQAASLDEPHTVSRVYRIALAEGIPDRVTLRVLMRPMALDLLDDLVDSGDLDPAVREAMPTFTVLDTLRWSKDDDGYGCVPKNPFSGG